MARYVDGFVLTVPRKNLAAYKRMAGFGRRIWMKYGALDYKECMIDDPNPSWVKRTFAKMAKPKAGEVTFFSFIVFRSKAHRDQVNAKVMKDPSMKMPPAGMPFDMNRMAYAGFQVVVDGKR
jgi:alkaline phosphatase